MNERGAPLWRPWQVVVRWMKQPAVSPGLAADLGRILDLLPDVRQLEVQTTHGRMTVTRDFSSSPVLEVDRILVWTFRNHPEISSIVFSTGELRPAHIATPAEPFSPPPSRPATEIMVASGQRDAMPEEANSRSVQLGSPGPAASKVPNGPWYDMLVGN